LYPNLECNQARNQLGTLRGRKFFWERPKIFKLCSIVLNYVQHIFLGRAIIFARGLRTPCAPIVTGLNAPIQIGKCTQVGIPALSWAYIQINSNKICRLFWYPYSYFAKNIFIKKAITRLTEHDDVKTPLFRGAPRQGLSLGPAPARAGSDSDDAFFKISNGVHRLLLSSIWCNLVVLSMLSPYFRVVSGFAGVVWFNHAFLRLKSRNNTNAAGGNGIASKITSWLYGDEKIYKIRNFMFRCLEIVF